MAFRSESHHSLLRITCNCKSGLECLNSPKTGGGRAKPYRPPPALRWRLGEANPALPQALVIVQVTANLPSPEKVNVTVWGPRIGRTRSSFESASCKEAPI